MDCNFSAWFAQLENCKKKPDGLSGMRNLRTLKTSTVCRYGLGLSLNQLSYSMTTKLFAERDMLWIQEICCYRIPSEPASLSSPSSKEPNAERQAKDGGRNLQNVLVAHSAGNGICLAESLSYFWASYYWIRLV